MKNVVNQRIFVEDKLFIEQELGNSSSSLPFSQKFHLFLSLYKNLYDFNNNPIELNEELNNSVIPNKERQKKRRKLISEISVLNSDNPIIKSVLNSSNHSLKNKEYNTKVFLRKLNTELFNSSLKLGEKSKNNHNNTEVEISLDKQVLFSLENNLTSATFDKLRNELGLKLLYSTSYCDHYLSNLKELVRIEYKISTNSSGVYICNNVNKVVQTWENMGLQFSAIKVSIDYGKDKTRLAINPLIPNDREDISVNQNSKLCIPILLHSGKEDYNKIPSDLFKNLDKELMITTDLGFWFQISKTCPVCHLSIKEFQDLNIQQQNSPKKHLFDNSTFFFCMLHLSQRLIVTVFQKIIYVNVHREKVLKEYICTHIRKTFNYGNNSKNDDSITIDQLTIWLNLNEALQLIRESNIVELLKLSELENNVLTLKKSLINSILGWKLNDWKLISNLNDFKTKLNLFDKLFLEFYGSHTYYSHALVDHLVDQINYLKDRGLTVFDLGNWNLENVHCVNSRFNSFKGSSRWMKSKEGTFLLPTDSIESELLKPLIVQLLRSNSFEKRSFLDLESNLIIKESKENRIREQRILFSKSANKSRTTIQNKRKRKFHKIWDSSFSD